MNELVYPTIIAGLPTTKANPTFSKNTFKMFIPNFADYVDSENGKIESIVNDILNPIPINTKTKIIFNNVSVASDIKVLNIDSNKDVILGKVTQTCYKEGYNIASDIIIDNPGSSEDIIITYYLGGEEAFSKTITLNALGTTEITVDKNIGNSILNSVLTVAIDTSEVITVNQFNNTVTSNFAAANGDAFALYEAFCNIADNKIIQSIWNAEWEYAMSLCIGHYLAVVNRETQRSFGLGDVAESSAPRGLMTVNVDKKRVEYKNIMLTRNQSKFWQSTEYGRILITLLDTKAVLTMMVAN